MSDETIPDFEGAAPKNRKKKRKYTRRPVSEKPGYVPRPKPASNLALTEIDSRLAQAIRDRAEAMGRVSELVHWQDRLGRLEQEINSLIGFQQRLSGKGQIDRVDIHGQTSDGRFTPPLASALPFSHLTPIPEGVTSIPSRQPKPTTPNQADIVGNEGGFS